MKSKLYALFFLTATLFFASCRTAKKMYEKGNYDEAVELAAKKLQKKPNDASTLDLLQNAYRFAVDDHESRIRSYASSSNDLRWEWTYNEYLDLQRLYESIRRVPAVFDVVHPTDYSSFVTTFQEEASNARFDRGLALMENATRGGSKQAYFEFQRALDLKPGDLAIKQKMDEAFDRAVVNVVVLPVEQTGYQYSSYNYGFVDINTNVLASLRSSNNNLFVRFYSAAQAQGMQVRVDQTVEMRFNHINVDRYRDFRSTREVSKQVVVKETVIKPDSVIKEYATVKARITTTRRTMNADGLLQVTVRNFDGKWLWSDAYTGNYNWTSEFSTFTGDSRALSEEDRKYCDRREEFPPSESEIIRVIMNEVQSKAQCGIRDYFNRL